MSLIQVLEKYRSGERLVLCIQARERLMVCVGTAQYSHREIKHNNYHGQKL